MPEYDEELHGDKYDYNPQAIESPSDAAVDYITRNARVKNKEDVIGLCSECKSVMPPGYMENNIFAAEGVPADCKYCGGVVVVTYRELANEHMKDTLDGVRGIGRS